MGSGKMMLDFFSAEVVARVCAKRVKKSQTITLRLGNDYKRALDQLLLHEKQDHWKES